MLEAAGINDVCKITEHSSQALASKSAADGKIYTIIRMESHGLSTNLSSIKIKAYAQEQDSANINNLNKFLSKSS
jgi:hypothetical protein